MQGPKERGPREDGHGTDSRLKGGSSCRGRVVKLGAPHHENAVSHTTKPGTQGLPQVHAATLCPLTNCHLQEEEGNPNEEQHYDVHYKEAACGEKADL